MAAFPSTKGERPTMFYFAISYCLSHFVTVLALDAITDRKVVPS